MRCDWPDARLICYRADYTHIEGNAAFMNRFCRYATIVAFVVGTATGSIAQSKPVFEEIGMPVMKAGLMGTIVGPGPTAGSERIYLNFRQEGGKLFLVSIDPDTGASEQFQSPVGTGAWGFMVGPDEKIYLGTHEGPDPGDSGQILVFDPRAPEKAIQVVGRPAESESYLWMFTTGADKKIYGCTFPGAKIVSYDPATGVMADHGVMDDTQQYSREIQTGPDGKIYTSIGYGKANVVRFDPATGTHEAILPEEYRSNEKQTFAGIYKGVDGKIYISAITMNPDATGVLQQGSAVLVVEADGVKVAEYPASAVSQVTLKDGRRVGNVTINGTYDLIAPDGTTAQRTFAYKGAGSGVFMVQNGPAGRIYGGTWMPNEIFSYDPATGALENPGNPTETGGEIYSMLDHHGLLYVCAYPGAFLSKWDPTKPWNYGREKTNNPQGFGNIGVGHLRPRAMIHGPAEKLYIGSFPEYGRLGGSLGVWDPETDTLIENYPQLIKNQSIVSLAYDSVTGLVFGGSSVVGGGGTTPSEKEAMFFAFDPVAKALKFERVVVPGDGSIRSMCILGRKLFGISGENTLFVYDIDGDKIEHTGRIDVGNIHDISLRPWSDGKIYGLSGKKVFRIEPASLALEVLAEYSGKIHCGFAMDEHGIYFGDGAKLMRYNWPAP